MRVEELKGLGAKKAKALETKDIYTAEDLLRYFPVDYEDRTSITPIGGLTVGQPALIFGRVTKVNNGGWHRGRKQVLRVEIADATGTLELVFFNGFLARAFRPGMDYYCFGTPTVNRNRLQMIHPTFEPESDEQNATGIKPVYRLIRGVSRKDLINWNRQILTSRYFQEVLSRDILPDWFLEKYGLCGAGDAYRMIHFPENMDEVGEANRRFLYENMLLLQIGLMLMRDKETEGIRFSDDPVEKEFIDSLPFSLTGAQTRTVEEVLCDMRKPAPMNRLIQGDVGSGKTAVAQIALFKAAKEGYQGAYMMPTEILARQQYDELKDLFAPFGIATALLVGSMSASEKREVLNGLAEGNVDVVVGTHALIQKGVEYQNLGLVITDEQHRFGVRQRSAIRQKGAEPDCIVMSATPIPRTLAMILFGDMDISIIDELPAGRIPIRTKAVTGNSRGKVYSFAAEQVAAGHQVYVVAPLIEESEALENVRSATEVYEDLCGRFPDFRIALLHGEMSADEKKAVMDDFAAGKTDILVSTVVIEVGINVPNATLMIIENSERFGLSQMHQLRGRVGRGKDPSYCVLITEDLGETSLARAKTMTESSDGFYIAEKDLELRGPGEMFGERQHGVPSAQIAGLLTHMDVYRQVEQDAVRILTEHPGLSDPETEELGEAVERVFGNDLTPTL